MSPSPEIQKAVEAVERLRRQIEQAPDLACDLILGEARTFNAWHDRPVSEALVRQAYDLAKMGPTSMNIQPMRLVIVRSAAGKAKLLPHLAEGNRSKSEAAPLVAIVGFDIAFFTRMPEVFPLRPSAASLFDSDPKLAEETAFRNGTLQAAFFMIALRALGLDLGPMSGFDAGGVDAAFFAGEQVRSNFILNIGYGRTDEAFFPRLPRLDFDKVARFA